MTERVFEKPLVQMSLEELNKELCVFQKQYDELLDAKTNKELVSLVFAKQLSGKAKALHQHLEVMHEIWIKEQSKLL